LDISLLSFILEGPNNGRIQNRCIKIDKDFGYHNPYQQVRYRKDCQESRHGAKRSIITMAAIAPKIHPSLSNSPFIKDEQTTNRAGRADLKSFVFTFVFIFKKNV
jgi:hypothetical protein